MFLNILKQVFSFQVTMVFANPDVKKYRWNHELFLFHIWKKLMDEYIWFIYIFLLVPIIANSFIKFTNALMGLLLLYIVLLSLYFIIIFIIYSLINTDLEFHIFHHNTSEFCWIIRQNSVTYYTLLTAPCLRHA